MNSSDPEFDRLFHAEFPAVVRTVFLICHDYHRAQDLTQDAFVELLGNWDRVAGFERLGAWVRRVAIRLAVRSVRRDALRLRAERAASTAPLTEPGDLDVLDAVKTLPVQQRAAVVLFYFEDAAVNEIADLLGCSPATARVHLHRARARLGQLLGDEEVARHGD